MKKIEKTVDMLISNQISRDVAIHRLSQINDISTSTYTYKCNINKLKEDWKMSLKEQLQDVLDNQDS